jgi:hypothetical protein
MIDPIKPCPATSQTMPRSIVTTDAGPHSTRSVGALRAASRLPFNPNLPHPNPLPQRQVQAQEQERTADWQLVSSSTFRTATIEAGPLQQAVLDTPSPSDPRAQELVMPPGFVPAPPH